MVKIPTMAPGESVTGLGKLPVLQVGFWLVAVQTYIRITENNLQCPKIHVLLTRRSKVQYKGSGQIHLVLAFRIRVVEEEGSEPVKPAPGPLCKIGIVILRTGRGGT